jgi:hypothetical protein
MNHDDIFEHEGKRFRVHIESDDNSDPPWERSDGHGPVRSINAYHRGDHPEKRPGERVLHKSGRTFWLYDWKEACRLARKDGWNAEPYDAPNRIERAVQADFDFLRGWLNDDWHYIGVCVTLVNDEDEDITDRYANALWGIESDARDYIETVAHELAGEVEVPPPPPHVELIVQALTMIKGDDAARYRKQFASFTEAGMQQPYGESGMTRQEWLDRAIAREAEIDAAINWVKGQS